MIAECCYVGHGCSGPTSIHLRGQAERPRDGACLSTPAPRHKGPPSVCKCVCVSASRVNALRVCVPLCPRVCPAVGSRFQEISSLEIALSTLSLSQGSSFFLLDLVDRPRAGEPTGARRRSSGKRERGMRSSGAPA